MDNKPFFHELSDSELESLVSEKVTWNDVKDRFIQPAWCDYPDALDGAMGCWSLVGYSEPGVPMWKRIRCIEDCSDCDQKKKGV